MEEVASGAWDAAGLGRRRSGMKMVLLCLLLGAAARVDGDGEGKSSWPCWRGPTSSGSVDEPAIEVVDDLGQAKRVWKSEERFPMPYGRGRQGKPIDTNPSFAVSVVSR